MARTSGKTSLAGRHILVVEDEYMIADDLCRALQEQGAIVLGPVPSVEGAIRLIGSSTDIDGAVLDFNLRGEPAFPIADVLAERAVPVLLSTGYGQSDIPERYVNLPRCEKPADPAIVVAAIGAIMRA